jgi:DNA polymerase-4
MLPGLGNELAAKPRTVLYVGLDGFVVAVELRGHPELRGLPVVVGGSGDPTRRGVVSGASAAARAYGVDAGTPLRLAARRCPRAVFRPLAVGACRAAAREVEAVLRSFPAAWEIAGWDEAYAEVDADDPAALACAIRRRLADVTGFVCSIGIGESKLQAKVASRLGRTGEIVQLDAASWPAMVGPLAPEVLIGVGPVRGRRLRRLGIDRVEQLAAADEHVLAAAFGPAVGPRLRAIARGEDTTSLVRRRPPSKSHGCARTFDEDVDDPAVVRETVARLAAAVARDLRRRRRLAVKVVVTVRYAPFETHSHAAATARPSADRDALEEAAAHALARFDLDRPVRMAGVRAELAPRTPRPRPPRRRPLPGPQPMLEPYGGGTP